MIVCSRPAVFMLSVVVASVFAAPKIEFDTKTFKCGTVIEGKAEKINAVFNVKNTGDATLKLTKVRPGCGCTVVKYDSVAEPGKSVAIEASVNIARYHSGNISKYITVTSNAENEPSVQLTIEATIESPITVAELTITVDAKDTAKSRTITLTSKKMDLKVSGVFFREIDNTRPADSQKSAQTPLKHKLAPTDSIRADGSHVFKLELFMPKRDKPATGETIIKTNHPDKPEIVLPTNFIK